MRAMQIFLCDIRYQFKYGFYFLYTIIAAVYIAILYFIPSTLQKPLAAIIILTDPATLGFFFVGAMILLERDEDLHSYYTITPGTVTEYILAKALSLALISGLSVIVIAGIVFGRQIHYPLLITGMIIGTPVFTLAGLMVGTFARSVNQYFLFSVPAGIFLITPAFITYTKYNHVLIEILPATQLLRVVQSALVLTTPVSPLLSLCGLSIWSAIIFKLATRVFGSYLHKGGS